jgi:hypothetical protein
MYGPQAALIAELHPAAAVHRLLDRLSALLGHLWRPCAADRDGAARPHRIGLCDRALYSVLRDRQYRRDRPDARLHQPGHFRGARQALIDLKPDI